MTEIMQLPRDENGIVVGQWRLRHSVKDYTDDIGMAAFRNGVTTRPLGGSDLDRIIAAIGEDVTIEPWDSDPRMHQPQIVVFEQAEIHIKPNPDLSLNEVLVQEESEAHALRSPVTIPTNEQELLSMNEEQLRDMAAELGCNDRRWKVQKLRRFIADELSIEVGETV